MSKSLREWLAEQPDADGRFTQSLAGVAERVLDGTAFLFAAREFLDEFGLTQSDAQRQRAIAQEPKSTGDRRHDAYLGALAEHLAARHDLRCPRWALAEGRTLERFWFVSEVKGFRAIAVAQAPMAFRRRGIFVPARSLTRV